MTAERARLLVVMAGPRKGTDGAEARNAELDLAPRTVTAAELHADTLHAGDLATVRGCRGRLQRRLPVTWGLAVEASVRSDGYDAVLTWGEAVAWPVALLLALRPRRPRHLSILLWPLDRTSPSRLKRTVKSRVFPTLARRGIDRYLVTAPAQRRRMMDEWHIPAAQMPACIKGLDTTFWRPLEPADQAGICAVGREMRDYETLVAALQGLDIPCHIAAATGPLNPAHGTEDERGRSVAEEDLPPGITLGPLSLLELRDLYAASRFVVVPVMPTDTDNGVTTTKEAMAMGRAVIATDTEGRTELIEDGVTGLLVPPRDPVALREAIVRLWEDPEEAARMGAAGRARMEEVGGLEQWRDAILDAAVAR